MSEQNKFDYNPRADMAQEAREAIENLNKEIQEIEHDLVAQKELLADTEEENEQDIKEGLKPHDTAWLKKNIEAFEGMIKKYQEIKAGYFSDIEKIRALDKEISERFMKSGKDETIN